MASKRPSDNQNPDEVKSVIFADKSCDSQEHMRLMEKMTEFERQERAARELIRQSYEDIARLREENTALKDEIKHRKKEYRDLQKKNKEEEAALENLTSCELGLRNSVNRMVRKRTQERKQEQLEKKH